MEKIRRKRTLKILLIIIGAILFVAGIPAIIIGASSGKTFLMVVGIICVVVNFYGLPMYGISLGKTCEMYKTCLLITSGACQDISELSQHIKKSEKDTLDFFRYCQSCELLLEYKLDKNNCFVLAKELKRVKEEQKEEEITKVVTCPGCGASVKIKGKFGVCPYCNKNIESN